MKSFIAVAFVSIWVAVGEGIAQHQPVIDPDPGVRDTALLLVRALANTRLSGNPAMFRVSINFLDEIARPTPLPLCSASCG